MKITIENTDKLVTLVVNGHDVTARVWQGQTEDGTPVQCFIVRIAPEIPKDDPRNDVFARQLREMARPRATVEAIPLRMII